MSAKFRILILALLVAPLLFACEAITKKGTKCRRAPMPGSQYCWQHGGRTKPQSTNVVTVVQQKSSVKSSDDNAQRTQCDATTKKGSRCTRKALPGGTKCWQHQ